MASLAHVLAFVVILLHLKMETPAPFSWRCSASTKGPRAYLSVEACETQFPRRLRFVDVTLPFFFCGRGRMVPCSLSTESAPNVPSLMFLSPSRFLIALAPRIPSACVARPADGALTTNTPKHLKVEVKEKRRNLD